MEKLTHAGKIIALIAITLGFIFLSSLKLCSGPGNPKQDKNIPAMSAKHTNNSDDIVAGY